MQYFSLSDVINVKDINFLLKEATMRNVILVGLLLLISGILFAASESLVIIDFVNQDSQSKAFATTLNKDLLNIFGKSTHFRVIMGRDVVNARKSLNIATSGNAVLNADEAGKIGDKLNASIVVWGTTHRVNNTHFRVTVDMRSQQTGAINRFSIQLPQERKSRERIMRDDMLVRIQSFSKEEMQKLVDIAIQQYNIREFANAERQFLLIVSLDPGNADALFYLAEMQFRGSNFIEAINYADRGLATDPEHIRLLEVLTSAYTQLRNFDEAIVSRLKLANIRGDKLDHKLLADLYNFSENYVEALLSLERALAIDPDFIVAREAFADIAYDQGMHSRAIPHLEYLADANPEDEVHARKLAFSYARTGQLDKAIERYLNMIQMDRNNINAYINLGNAYRQLAVENRQEADRYNRLALSTFQDAKRTNITNARTATRVELLIANVYLTLNDLTNAERFANSTRQMDPTTHEAFFILGEIAQRRGASIHANFVDLQRLTDSNTIFGREQDEAIARRERAKAEAHTHFNRADSFFRDAARLAESDRVRDDINSRIRDNRRNIEDTKPDFFSN
jgi:tetratricopeptide (TPR) repeat protein